VRYDVEVTDSAGNPIEAELALNLVDLSVLTLADRPGRDIVDHFWRERGLGVRTANDLTRSGDRVNEQLASEVKGLGGGGGFDEFGAVRRRFPDTAYWNPALRTGADGHATVSVELPDSLTTWRLGARGITTETLVGYADVDVISTKDLLIRPVAPRFFVVGDEAELAAVLHNNTDELLMVEVIFEADGVRIGESASQRVSVPGNDKVKVTWPVTAEDVQEVTLRFGARVIGERVDGRGPGDALETRFFPKNLVSVTDAVEITLPVYRTRRWRPAWWTVSSTWSIIPTSASSRWSAASCPTSSPTGPSRNWGSTGQIWRSTCRSWSAPACSGSTTSSTTTAAGAGGSLTSPIPF
jgi:hypothetical protein